MVDSTTIKVPKELRDRIAERAMREQTTLASVIARVLDEADDRVFWSAVEKDHASLTAEARASYASNAGRADNLVDASDDTLTAEGKW